jgi:hypothetical protein
MYNLILDRNYKHFVQANSTPFTEAPLKDWLGKYGEMETGQAFLKGELQPILENATFSETQTILDLLQPFEPPADPVSSLITLTDFKFRFGK